MRRIVGEDAIRVWPLMWSAALAVLMLGGALGPGYTLSYDMVWVPDLTLGRDVLGVGSALPRAIPSDAVVAVLDEVLGGALLQKVVLLGTLVGAGAGFAAMVRERTTGAQLVAVTVGVWNPYVVERLLLGHWPLLIGYAVLPWLFVALRVGTTVGLPVRVLPLIVLGSLNASAGMMTVVVALTVAGRGPVRRTLVLLLGLLAANAPWVVAGLTSPASTTSDPAGALVFGTADEGLMSGPLAALSFGGVWNADVVPASRLGVAGVALTVLLVAAVVVGIALVVRGARVQDLAALTVCWCAGWGLAVLSWTAPEALGWFGEHVPAGGLLRDGSRLLGLAVPLVAVLVAAMVDGLLSRLPERGPRLVAAGALALVPLTLMPDAVWGMRGQLSAVSYPAEYESVRRAISLAPPGDVVSLPFESYRAPEWNDYHRVLDPLGRYLDRHAVVSDVLVVSGERLAGEDPRAAAVGRALEAPSPAGRSVALRAAGISAVVLEEIDGYPVPALAGERVVDGDLSVVVVGPAAVPERSTGRAVVTGLGWVAWLSALGGPLAVLLARRAAERRRARSPG